MINLIPLLVIFLLGILAGIVGTLILWFLFEVITWILVIGIFIKHLYED